jgi:hypothetical protein
MPEFLQLPRDERLQALNYAADQSGIPVHLLDKDVWVVWCLQHLFEGPHAKELVFKGGTSLSKAYGVIRRFSEDIDLTYDIRAIAKDLIGDLAQPLPPSRSQAKKWTAEIRSRLASWVASEIAPAMDKAIAQQKLPAKVRAEADRIFVEYEPVAEGTGYIAPRVMLEFGARSTGEPHEDKDIVCDAAAHVGEITWPKACVQVMRAERTFWEKATAIHVFCFQGEYRGGDRYARHWHDLVRLDQSGFADAAIADRELAKAVASHKAMFFTENDTDGKPISYDTAVSGDLRLVPGDGALAKLADDYKHMIDDGLFLDDVESFDALMDRCRAIEAKANKPHSD